MMTQMFANQQQQMQQQMQQQQQQMQQQQRMQQQMQQQQVHQSNSVRIPEYDGEVCYSMWRAQFQALTSGLSRIEQEQKLVAALRGKALMVLPMLEQQQKLPTFEELDNILTKMFTAVTSLWQRKRNFETLVQKPGQTLQDFARELERVGRAFMVTYPEKDLQEALVTAFVKGLQDKQAAERLAYAPCNTLAEAMKNLNRGLLLTEEVPAKRVRMAEAEEAVEEEYEGEGDEAEDDY